MPLVSFLIISAIIVIGLSIGVSVSMDAGISYFVPSTRSVHVPKYHAHTLSKTAFAIISASRFAPVRLSNEVVRPWIHSSNVDLISFLVGSFLSSLSSHLKSH